MGFLRIFGQPTTSSMFICLPHTVEVAHFLSFIVSLQDCAKFPRVIFRIFSVKPHHCCIFSIFQLLFISVCVCVVNCCIYSLYSTTNLISENVFVE